MDEEPKLDCSELLRSAVGGNESDESALRAAVYAELRVIAGVYFSGQQPEHTLQPTALVNEAVVRLLGSSTEVPKDRAHFLALAANAMRHILIDHARRKRAAKRGGGKGIRIPLDGVMSDGDNRSIDPIDIDQALQQLAKIDERQARIVELRFYAGLRVSEVATLLGISDRTVEMDWRMARAWLRRELRETTA